MTHTTITPEVYSVKHLRPESVAAITAKIQAKHANIYYLSVTDSDHCVLGYSVHALVELEEEKIYYRTDAAGRLRVTKRERLTPTYLSIRKQPKDSVVIIRGGKYDGQYICGGGHDGWYDTTFDINKVVKIRYSYAIETRNRIAFNAQYCYRGTFEIVTL